MTESELDRILRPQMAQSGNLRQKIPRLVYGKHVCNDVKLFKAARAVVNALNLWCTTFGYDYLKVRRSWYSRTWFALSYLKTIEMTQNYESSFAVFVRASDLTFVSTPVHAATDR